MKKFLVLLVLAVAALVLAPSVVVAQTPSYRVQWDQPEPVATVQAYQFSFKQGTAAAVMLAPTCVANGAATRCTAPVAQGSGPIVVTAFNGFGSAASAPLTGSAPGVPSGVTVTVTVTVTTGP